MWPFNKLRSISTVPNRKRRWCELWTEFVPKFGDADTWQGEVLRIVARMEDEANRNGFCNWSEEHDRELERMVNRICDDETFSDETKTKIRRFAAVVKRAGHDTSQPMPLRKEWEDLHFWAVDWCDAQPAPIWIRGDGEYLGHE